MRLLYFFVAGLLFCIVAGVVYVRFIAQEGEPREPPRGPYNVILISIDTLRSDHLSCYGYDIDVAPNICAFAGEGILFKRCIAQASSTLTSHASIFTSMIPSHHGAKHSEKRRISSEIETLTEVLKENGYATAAFTGGGQISSEFFNDGFDVYYEEKGSSPTVFDYALRWLNTSKDSKFFLFIHTYETHLPYTPREEFALAVEHRYNGTLPRNITRTVVEPINQHKSNITAADARHIKAMYDAEIMMVDAKFKRLIDSIKGMGLYNETVIVFTSDHGEEFGEHGIWGWHGHTLYNELLRVPLIVKLPDREMRGIEKRKLVRSIDIAPTILDFLNITMPAYYEGDSLLPLTYGGEWNVEYALSELDTSDLNNNCSSAIQNLEWKRYCKRIYSLKADPHEKRPSIRRYSLAGINQYDKLYELREQWFDYKIPNKTAPYAPLKPTSAGNTTGTKANLSEKTLDRLKSLGYIEAEGVIQ